MITFKIGLKFPSIEILRVIVQQYVKTKYDYYSLHYVSKTFNAYCVDRFNKCPWNKKKLNRNKTSLFESFN